jgi:MFS family permease
VNALRKDLRAISADGTAANVMIGIGENYFPAFVLALSANELASGLVATVPMVAGAVLQLAAPFALQRFSSYRSWTVCCAVLQAAAFVPLMVAALLGTMPLAGVFVAVSLYWATGLAGGSAWNTWVDTLVPSQLRTRYFARRTRLCQLGLMLGIVVGGVALQAGAKLGQPLTFFAVLFAVALGSRAVSAHFLGTQREPVPPGDEIHPLNLHHLMEALRTHATGRKLLYLLAAQMAVQIAGPFFTPYMLSQLGLSYTAYVVLICIPYLAKIVCLPALGRLADRWGADRLLWLGGLAIVPVAGLWTVSDSFPFLCFAQVVSGAAWAAYELAMLLQFFETIPANRRVSVLTVFNLANSSAFLVGSLIGGALLINFGASREAYLLLFVVSSSARAAALLLLVPALRRAEPASAPVGQLAPQLVAISVSWPAPPRLYNGARIEGRQLQAAMAVSLPAVDLPGESDQEVRKSA